FEQTQVPLAGRRLLVQNICQVARNQSAIQRSKERCSINKTAARSIYKDRGTPGTAGKEVGPDNSSRQFSEGGVEAEVVAAARKVFVCYELEVLEKVTLCSRRFGVRCAHNN